VTALYVLAGAAGVALLWGALMYNALVRLRNHCREAWSNVDTELKRRYELVPNLVETVKGYAKYEQDVLERVVRARGRAMAAQGRPREQAEQENALVGALQTMFAVAESYPDLKASGHFLALQRELTNTEDRIQAARRFYNANVRDLNTRVESVPSNLIANLCSIQPEDYFQIQDGSVRTLPDASVQ